MIKVSFNKETYKKVERYGEGTTLVILTGTLQIPNEILYGYCDQKSDCRKIEIIRVGRAVRAAEDADDPVLAERIAECKAKIKIYSFMMKFLGKYIDYYSKLLIGSEKSIGSTASVKQDSIFGAYERHYRLCSRELEHYKELTGMDYTKRHKV